MLSKQMVLGVAFALVASPGIAADSAQAGEAAKKPAATTKEKTYCIAEATTGTRMTSKVCKTKSEWRKDGVDIEAEAGEK